MAPYTDPNEVFALLRATDDTEILEAARQAVEERLGQLFPDAPGSPHVQTSDEYRPGVQAQPLVAPAPAGNGGTDVFEQEKLAQDNYQLQAEEGRQIRQAQPVFVTNTGATEDQRGQATETRELLADRQQQQQQAAANVQPQQPQQPAQQQRQAQPPRPPAKQPARGQAAADDKFRRLSEQQAGYGRSSAEFSVPQEGGQAARQGAQGGQGAQGPAKAAEPPKAQPEGQGGPEGKGNAVENPAARPDVRRAAGQGSSSQGFTEGSDQGQALRHGGQ
jgi:hypothetical protein